MTLKIFFSILIFFSPPVRGFSFEGVKKGLSYHTDGAGSGNDVEAMDTSAPGLPPVTMPTPRSPAIATRNTTHQNAFPGTQGRPPHLQML